MRKRISMRPARQRRVLFIAMFFFAAVCDSRAWQQVGLRATSPLRQRKSSAPRTKLHGHWASSLRGGSRVSTSLSTATGANSSLSTTRKKSSSVTNTEASDKGDDTMLDKLLFAVYLCTCVGSSLPTILMPLIATTAPSPGAFIAVTASMAALGGGFGKLVNGFLCQAVGGKALSTVYLIGITLCTSILSCLSKAGPAVGLTLAGLEFFVSAQWPACSLVLSNHFGKKPKRFAEAITMLSLSSTTGTLVGKLGGAALLPVVPSWRIAARAGAAITLTGALLMLVLVPEYPVGDKKSRKNVIENEASQHGMSFSQIGSSLRSVAASRLFWWTALAHSTTYLVRTVDRVLPALFSELTALPKSMCGVLTAGVTLGFVHGLNKGKQFHTMTDSAEKTRLLKKNYLRSVILTLLLGAISFKKPSFLFQTIQERLSTQSALAGVLAILTAGMSSSLAFQFYQIPPQVASIFGENKAVCLSFLDAAGFFMSALVWGAAGKIVGSMGGVGWPVTMVLLSALFGFGGLIMSKQYETIEKCVAKATRNA